jgi:hypothetical protein
MNFLRNGRCRSLYLSVKRALNIVIIDNLSPTYKIFSPFVKVHSVCRGNYWGSSVWILSNGLTAAHIYCIHQILEKKCECNEEVLMMFIDLKKASDSDRR